MNKTLNLLLFSVMCFSIMAFTPNRDNSAFTFNEMVKIYEDNAIAFSIESTSTSAFVQSKFDKDSDNFQISTEKVISFIQVSDESGNLHFQMPVETNQLHLNISDFAPGNYKLAFMFQEKKFLVHATLNKKV